MVQEWTAYIGVEDIEGHDDVDAVGEQIARLRAVLSRDDDRDRGGSSRDDRPRARDPRRPALPGGAPGMAAPPRPAVRPGAPRACVDLCPGGAVHRAAGGLDPGIATRLGQRHRPGGPRAPERALALPREVDPDDRPGLGALIRDQNGNTLDVMIEAFGGIGGLRIPVDIARVIGAKAELSGQLHHRDVGADRGGGPMTDDLTRASSDASPCGEK